MLPSSHPAPIKPSLADAQSDGVLNERARRRPRKGNVRAQGLKRGPNVVETSVEMLAGEFSEFIRAAAGLETSYRALQAEVSELGMQLSERNADLQASFEQNERMRLELQQIVDSMPCGVLVVDRDGHISMINPESLRLLGIEANLIAQNSKPTVQQISLLSGKDLDAIWKGSAGSDSEQEFYVQSSAGDRWLGVRNRGLFRQCDSEGIPDQTILILRDISSRKRAEQEREAARRALALAEIATVLAHEIRNPLGSLELFAELIERDSPSRSEWITHLRAGIRSLSGTVNNVLSFHSSRSLKLSSISMTELIRDSVQFARPLADQASVSLEWAGCHDEMCVMGNENALQQVVMNVISNAIRHTPAGGRVTVRIRTERLGTTGQEWVAVDFSDTGCGIRSEQIDHIFEPGFSGRGDTTGLGLAVCRRIMHQHGGEIEASNCSPTGARFTLTLAKRGAEAATA